MTQFDLNEKMLQVLHYQHQHAPEGRRLLVSGHFAHKEHGAIPEHLVLHRPPGVPVAGVTKDGLLIAQHTENFNGIEYDSTTSTPVEIFPVAGFAQTYMFEQKDWVLSR